MTGIVIVPPLAVTAAMITATDVTEADYTAWSASTFYSVGERVISTTTHKIYESMVEAEIVTCTIATGTLYMGFDCLIVTHAGVDPAADTRVVFTTTGTLPAPLVAGTAYYVRRPRATLFAVSTTSGGAEILLTSAGSGTHAFSTAGNQDPADDTTIGTYWLEVSPTNRWKLLDTSNSTKTAKATSFYYEITPGVALDTVFVGAIVGGTSMRVRLTDGTAGVVYDQTITLGSAVQAIFTAIPSYPAAVLRLDAAGGATLAVGVLLLGDGTTYGSGIAYGARVGRKIYSVQTENEFGDMTLVPRPSARKLQVTARIANTELDAFDLAMAAIDSVPCLFILYAGYAVTTVFGIYKSYEILISYPTASDVSLDFLGFS